MEAAHDYISQEGEESCQVKPAGTEDSQDQPALLHSVQIGAHIKSEPKSPKAEGNITHGPELPQCPNAPEAHCVESAPLKQEAVKEEPNDSEVHTIQIKEEPMECETPYPGAESNGIFITQNFMSRPTPVKQENCDPADRKPELDSVHTGRKTAWIKAEPVADSECNHSEASEEFDLCMVKDEVNGNQLSALKSLQKETDALASKDEAGSNSEFFPCSHCTISFTDPSYLEKHLKWTHQEQYLVLLQSRSSRGKRSRCTQKTVSCPHCRSPFASQRHLAAHLRQAHPSPAPKKQHPCPQCPRSFHYLASLQKHCKHWHKLDTICVEGHLNCADCGTHLGASDTLRPHICSDAGEKLKEGPVGTSGGLECSPLNKTWGVAQTGMN
ncbi:hypothetical protein AGOR_G00035480 [Albula goreensis]|uniref:C2H2-type domain-containing protein n=1 Tax=Albula goreensis TaxID=1534307 RepID=A0A8T3DX62_9TELE|nr:hypothetical protein AGOR_G00035480 [Albula goreensis]